MHSLSLETMAGQQGLGYPPFQRDCYRGSSLHVSGEEVTSLSRQDRVGLPTQKASRGANPWRFGPECSSSVLHFL